MPLTQKKFVQIDKKLNKIIKMVRPKNKGHDLKLSEETKSYLVIMNLLANNCVSIGFYFEIFVQLFASIRNKYRRM